MTDVAARARPRVVVCGADHAGLAARLARAGCPVVLLEPDPHDRARLADLLARPGGAEFVLTGEAGAVADADVVLAGGGAVPGPAAHGVPVLALDWGGAEDTALHLSALPGRRPLLEVMGPDPGGLAAAIGRALGARTLGLPAGHVPPSQRLLAVLGAEIEALALTAATPEEIDSALAAAGFAPGPFEAQDLAGIDTCLAARRAVFARHPGPPELPLVARAVAEGRLGRKVGVGWYRYPGGGGKVEDPLVEDMATEEARFAGLPRAALDADAIRARVLAVLRAEAARIADEGGLSLSEIDEVAQLAIGSPPHLLDRGRAPW